MDQYDTLRGKVTGFFQKSVGPKSERLHGPLPPLASSIWKVLQNRMDHERAWDIAFHLSDWSDDAAFLIALALEPELFTEEEIDAGLRSFLDHAPNHVAAAAKLAGQPVTDIFDIGAVDGDV